MYRAGLIYKKRMHSYNRREKSWNILYSRWTFLRTGQRVVNSHIRTHFICKRTVRFVHRCTSLFFCIEQCARHTFHMGSFASRTANVLWARIFDTESSITRGWTHCTTFHVVGKIAYRFICIEQKFVGTFSGEHLTATARKVALTWWIITMKCTWFIWCT